MIKKIPHIFTREFPFIEKYELFKRALYILLLFNTITLLPIAWDLFSYHGIVGTIGWNTSVPWYLQGSTGLLNLLSHPANSTYEWLYIFFIAGQLIFLVTGILRIFPVISSVLIYFFTVNLFIKGGFAFTGGEGLVNIILFYMMFIHKPRNSGRLGDLQNILNNTFWWILLLQICVLYFFSAVFKFLDPLWMGGYAVMYVSRIDVYNSMLTVPLENNYWLSAIVTYSVIVYQFFFAFAVWIKKIKVPFLVYGVIFHFLIAVGMGIFNFGMVMIVTYLLFLDLDQIKRLASFFKRKRATENA